MKSLKKRFGQDKDVERTKQDDKILEFVLANDVEKLRAAVEKKKYSVIHSHDEKGRIAIFEACRLGFRDCVDILAGVDIDPIPTDADGYTPLHTAAVAGQRDCIIALLRRGIAANTMDEHQSTALHLAASLGKLDVLQTLIAYQADTEARDAEQNTPLIVAAINGQTDAASTLLQNSVSVNASNASDRTALMYAAERGNLALVQQLLQCGAQPEKKDNKGSTARALAAAAGHEECQRVLATAETSAPVAQTPKREPSKAEALLRPAAGRPAALGVINGGEDLRRQLHEAREEIATLKAQLDAFRKDQDSGDEVEFGSDDEIDLGDGPSADGAAKQTPKADHEESKAIKHLRHELEQTRAQLASARAAATSAESEKESARSEALSASEREQAAVTLIEELKEELAAARANSETAATAIPAGYVPESELASLKAKIATLTAAAAAAASAAPDATAGPDPALLQAHAEEIAAVRAQAAAEAQAQITAASQQVAQVQKDLQAKITASEKLSSEIAALHEAAKRSAAEKEALAARVASLQEEKARLHESLADEMVQLTDVNAKSTQEHQKTLQLYRYYLALAVKGALPADVSQSILNVVSHHTA